MSAASPPPFSVPGPYNNGENQNGNRSNKSSTGIGGPPDGTRHIDDLLAEAERRSRDLQHLPIGHLINSAKDSARYAESLAEYRKRDQAYVEYMFAYELIVNIIPTNKDWVALNGQKHSALYKLFRETLLRISDDNDRFDKIKSIIVNENNRLGIQARSRTSTPNPPSTSSSRPLSQQSSRPVSRINDELFLDPPENGNTNGTPPLVPARPRSVEVASSLDSTSPANSLRSRPTPRPKPESLHGNALPHGHSPVNSTVDELSQRFARLRAAGTQSPAASQYSQPPNGAVRMPSPNQYSSAPSDGSMAPPPRPSGPRGMPNLPPKLPLDTQLAVQMPKPPSPTYSPARNMQTPQGVNPPRSTARSAVGSRNNSIATSSASARAPGDTDGNSYFPSALSRETSREQGPATNGSSRRNGSFGLPSEGREIEPNMLFDYMKMFRVLLIDVRSRQEFDQGHIDSPAIVCIEPLTLRSGMSDEHLESTMILSPDAELTHFSRRDMFDLVVCYDYRTQTSAFLTKVDRTQEEEVLRILFDALSELNVAKTLNRSPLLLTGGIEAWSNLLGYAALRTSDTAATKAAKALQPKRRPVPAPSAAATLAMEKRRRREYNPLDPEEERKWLESARKESVYIESLTVDGEGEGEDQFDEEEAEDPAFYRTQADFFRRFPAVELEQESMMQAPARSEVYYPQVSQPSSQPPPLPSYPASAAHNEMPSRPPPAAARVSYSGAHDRAPYNPPSRNQQLRPYVPIKDMPHNVRLPKTGLVNFGVTCYMNATIQCLNATIPLTTQIRNDSFRQFIQRDNWKGSKGLMTEYYSNLIKNLWIGDVTACRPSSFRQLCARFGPSWGVDQQQDAKEFLEFVMDLLHEDLNVNWRNPPPHVLSTEEEKFREQLAKPFAAQVEWARHAKRDKSLISDLFAGQHCSQLRCLKCGHTSTTYEMFMSISVEIPRSGQSNIYECLKMYCREERLAGGEKWFCPMCKKDREATKRITITRAPRYLVVHFKRFAAGLHQSAKKVHTPIDFPLRNMDISDFMAPLPTDDERQRAAQATGDMKYLTRRLEDPMLPPYTYDAYAVMRHLGASLSSGHYISLVRDGGRGKWREFNDDKVHDFVPGDGKALQDGRAYIVFFERTGMNGIEHLLPDGKEMVRMARKLGVTTLSDQQLEYYADMVPEGWI